MDGNKNIHLPEIVLYRQYLRLPRVIRDYLEGTLDATESYGVERIVERAHEGEWDRDLAIASEERWAKYREILKYVAWWARENPSFTKRGLKRVVRDYVRARLLLPRFSHKIGDPHETEMFLRFMRLPPKIRELLAQQCEPAECYFALRYGEQEVEKVTGSRHSITDRWRWEEYGELKKRIAKLCFETPQSPSTRKAGKRARTPASEDYEPAIVYTVDRLQL